MRQRYGEIQAKGTDVVAISFERRNRLFQHTRQLQLPFTILTDPERNVYSAYGLERGDWLKIFSPQTVWTYIKHFVRGRRYYHSSSDWRQLGGDFILGEDGTVLYEHRGQAPHDRPTVACLIAKLDG